MRVKDTVLGKLLLAFCALPEGVLGLLWDLCEKLSGESGDVFLVEFRKFLRKESCWIYCVTGYLELISGTEVLELESTDGKETIAQARDLFTGYIDPDFRNYGCDVKGKPTEETNVTVHEMIKDGTFTQIFGGLNNNLDSLCLTQAQIIQFVKKHRKWLRTDDYATFFLFKVGTEFLVAHVDVDSDGLLSAYVNRFSDDGVWSAGYRDRIVIPQLAP